MPRGRVAGPPCIGVQKAVDNVCSVIAPALLASGLHVTQQADIDAWLNALDGTPKKSRLGANAILGVSMAVARAGAAHAGLPLYEHIAHLAGNRVDSLCMPCPAFNVINGGAHASNPIAFQEFMILPRGATSFKQAMQMGCEVYQHLKQLLGKKYHLGKDAGRLVCVCARRLPTRDPGGRRGRLCAAADVPGGHDANHRAGDRSLRASGQN